MSNNRAQGIPHYPLSNTHESGLGVTPMESSLPNPAEGGTILRPAKHSQSPNFRRLGASRELSWARGDEEEKETKQVAATKTTSCKLQLKYFRLAFCQTVPAAPWLTP